MLSNISEWEVKYDLEINEKDKEIKNISKKRKNLLERLSILQNRKIVENLQNSKEMELKNIEIEKIKADKLLLKIQNRSTRVIVREIRAYIKYKKEVEALKGKGKKDKKGGKKGGKKK
jgi:phosphopantetheine adenylyltransferase